MKLATIAFGFLLLVPLSAADTGYCGDTACAQTESYQFGSGECGEEGTSHVYHRGVVVAAHLGVVSVIGRVESECWRGTYENGTHESQTWTAAGVTFESPLGPHGPGVSWVSGSTADEENTREDCRMFISYVGNVGCPAGQPAPFIAPALP